MKKIVICGYDEALYKMKFSGADIVFLPAARDEASRLGVISSLKKGDSAFFLDPSYPSAGSEGYSENFFKAAKDAGVGVYAEFPSGIAGYASYGVQRASKERLVTTVPVGSVGPQRILGAGQCFFTRFTVPEQDVLAVLARVAGYDGLIYPIDADTCSYPFVFRREGTENTLICASSLFSFVRSRYAPFEAWKSLLEAVFRIVSGENVKIEASPTVKPSYSREERLPKDAKRAAAVRSLAWFEKNCVTSTYDSKTVIEGFSSETRPDGSQVRHVNLRPDCIGEAAMMTSLGYRLTGDPAAKEDSLSLLKNVTLKKSVLFPESTVLVSDRESPMYGLMNWTMTQKLFYGDDNARALLGMITARSVLGKEALSYLPELDKDILRCALANLRTTGKNGFRHSSLSSSSFDGKSWRDFYGEDLVHPSAHYNAYLWALYIEIYALTGMEEFLERSKKAIDVMFSLGFEKWAWQNSLSGEYARMLLPLAFLVRVEDTPENRSRLLCVTEKVASLMQPCGAVRDLYGELSLGHYPPARSNARYGMTEAPIIQENGDPATDLLYTANWALIGLREAYLVLGDGRIKELYERLCDFLCRIQITGADHPELDGAWMRAFDYEKWDFWANSSDSGWGACCVESGWTNTWIASAMMLDLLGGSLFRPDLKDDFSSVAPDLKKEMLG